MAKKKRSLTEVFLVIGVICATVSVTVYFLQAETLAISIGFGIGALVMFPGTIITMIPNKRELKLARKNKADAAPRDEVGIRHEVA